MTKRSRSRVIVRKGDVEGRGGRKDRTLQENLPLDNQSGIGNDALKDFPAYALLDALTYRA